MDRQCSVEHIVKIAEFLPRWKNVGRLLGFSEQQLNDLTAQYPDPAELRGEMLAKWVAISGPGATYKKLYDTLVKLDEGDAAEKVRRLVERPSDSTRRHVHVPPVRPHKVDSRPDNSGLVNGPCFDGEGLVQMASGERKLVKNLKHGDQVASAHGSVATVQALIETPIPEGQLTDIVDVEGVSLTPWHPVQTSANGQWVFPADLHPPKKVSIKAIYNLVLDSHHVVTINTLNVITLGHNKTEGVLAHPYFGSEKVLDDLKRHPGWSSGHLLIVEPKVERDVNGLVCKFF